MEKKPNKFKKVRLGDLLLNAGLVNELQIQTAIHLQKEKGGKLGDILVEQKFVTEQDMAKLLSEQLKIKFVDLNTYNLNADVIRKIPENISRKCSALLLEEKNGEYIVGMVDPTDIVSYDQIYEQLGSTFKAVLVLASDLLKVIDRIYRKTEEISSRAEELRSTISGTNLELLSDTDELAAEAAPVAKLLESIFEDAVQVRASDIHIEPDANKLRIRQRIDGVLNEHIIPQVPKKPIASALVSKIKLISKLNISEKRIPQDGRFQFTVRGKTIDVRVSTMPTQHGESVVMRLLEQSSQLLQMDQLGLPDYVLERLLYLIHRPNGMLLVTGPTGSGKTTTLYAAISELNTAERKIITIEDPIEYSIPRITQVQVNTAIGLTFATVLRSTLRQDPNIIMIGEMRDEETVSIGLRASMTGHFVLSTLHTNDSISSAMRLIDMGAQGFLVASGLRAVIAQRLMRKICEHCKTEYVLSKTEESWLNNLFSHYKGGKKFNIGKGCSRCNNSGYSGRMGVYELLEIDAGLSTALRENNPEAFGNIARQQKHFKPLSLSALEAAESGKTTVEELLRISVS
jgi:MSHA biogenesis protein MshE